MQISDVADQIRQVKRADLMEGKGVRQMGPQEVDIISIVKPITKYAARVMDPAGIKFHLQKAIHLAQTGRRGPVWLDIPLDVQGAIIDESSLESFVPPPVVPAADLNQKIQQTITLMNKAQRPVVLAGNGIRSAKVVGDFLKLIDAWQVPVLTTWKALDLLPENHPLYCGRPGSIAQRGANFIQQNADLIITIGARLDLCQVAFNYKNFAREAKKIVNDIDLSEINKIDTPIDVAVAADAKDFIQGLLSSAGVQKKDPSWLIQCLGWKNKYPSVLPEHRNSTAGVNTYVLVDELSKILTEKDVIVPGSSASCSEVTLQTFKVKAGQRVLNSPGLGSMGFGLPASIGACIASGGRRTVCIIGDGGLQHNIQELELLKRYHLPIKLFVLNNNGYMSIKSSQTNHFKKLVACDPQSGLTLPDTIKIAAAYGLATAQIENHAALEQKLAGILGSDGPTVCEVMVDAATATAPRVTSEVKPDGKIVSKPMEDLWPLLSREEFKANMIVKTLE